MIYIYKDGKMEPYENKIEVDEEVKPLRKRKPEFRYECPIKFRDKFSAYLKERGLVRSTTMHKLMQDFMDSE